MERVIFDLPALGLMVDVPGTWALALDEGPIAMLCPIRFAGSAWPFVPLQLVISAHPSDSSDVAVGARALMARRGAAEEPLSNEVLSGRQALRSEWTDGVLDITSWFVRSPRHESQFVEFCLSRPQRNAPHDLGLQIADAEVESLTALLHSIRWRNQGVLVDILNHLDRRNDAYALASVIGDTMRGSRDHARQCAERLINGQRCTLQGLTRHEADILSEQLSQMGFKAVVASGD